MERLTDVPAGSLLNGCEQLRAERPRVLAPSNLESARVEHKAGHVGPLVEGSRASRVDERDKLGAAERGKYW